MHVPEDQLLRLLGGYIEIADRQGRYEKAKAVRCILAKFRPLLESHVRTEYEKLDGQMLTLLHDYESQCDVAGLVELRTVARGAIEYFSAVKE